MAPGDGTLPERAFIDDDGVWVQVLSRPPGLQPRPALFLDRDGVIIDEVGYLGEAEHVRLIPGAGAVIAAANARDIPVVVVTNQSAIGRRLFAWDGFIAVQSRMLELLDAGGALVDAVLACPHHAEAEPPYDHPDHPARKPNPGMLMRAAQVLPIDLRESWIVGDRADDLLAGRNAGIAGGLHVATGGGGNAEERTSALALQQSGAFRVCVGRSILAALVSVPLLAGRFPDSATKPIDVR